MLGSRVERTSCVPRPRSPQAACTLVDGSLGLPNGDNDVGPYFVYTISSNIALVFCEGGIRGRDAPCGSCPLLRSQTS